MPFVGNFFSAVDPNAHQYWRLREMRGQIDTNAGLAEMTLRSAIGGSAQTYTAVAHDTTAGRPVSNLYDGSLSSIYTTSGGNVYHDIVIDFGSPKVLAEIEMVSYGSVTGSSGGTSWAIRQGFHGFSVDYSDDNSTFTAVAWWWTPRFTESGLVYNETRKLQTGLESGHPTSFSNSGGTGNRSGSITVSTNISLATGAIGNLVDGTTTGFTFSAGSNSGTQEIKFDFGSSVTIDAIRWRQASDVPNNGIWVMEGSPDNSSWTQLGYPFVLGGGRLSIATDSYNYFENSTAYRYYRLRGISGARSTTTTMQEIEFRIA